MRLEVTGWGVAEGIPTLVVAASSLDDVVAITGFGIALAVALSTQTSLISTLVWGPLEALIGAGFGASVGILLILFPPPRLVNILQIFLFFNNIYYYLDKIMQNLFLFIYLSHN